MGNQVDKNMYTIDTSGFSKIIQDFEDPFYGKVTIWQSNSTMQLIAVGNHTFSDKKQHDLALNFCRIQSQLVHESIVKLYSMQEKQQENFCISSTFEILLLYEYIDYDLSKDIERRQIHNKPYLESELWFILASVLAGLSYLKMNDVQMGNIQPSAIFIDYMGNVKIMTKGYFSYNFNSYAQFLQGKINEKIYLSPELLDNLKQHNIIPQYDSYKSDVYTLGLVILECAQLQKIENLNNFQNFEIDQNSLNNALKNLEGEKSSNFIQFLKLMLESDENIRLSPDKLFSKIQRQCFAKYIEVSDRIISS